MNKHHFFSSISFVRISYKTIWLKTWSWYKKPTEKWKLERLRLVFSKRRASKIWGRISDVRFKKNSTPSPWKRRKTSQSAIFCTTGVWGLTFFTFNRVATTFSICYIEKLTFDQFVAFIGVVGLKFCLEIGKKVRILCIHKNRTVVYEHVTWHSRPFF